MNRVTCFQQHFERPDKRLDLGSELSSISPLSTTQKAKKYKENK